MTDDVAAWTNSLHETKEHWQNSNRVTGTTGISGKEMVKLSQMTPVQPTRYRGQLQGDVPK